MTDNRARAMLTKYPHLFSRERDDKLPKWAQRMLDDFRLLLLREAGRNQYLQDKIRRLESGHRD